jgi:hypothetical protein
MLDQSSVRAISDHPTVGQRRLAPMSDTSPLLGRADRASWSGPFRIWGSAPTGSAPGPIPWPPVRPRPAGWDEANQAAAQHLPAPMLAACSDHRLKVAHSPASAAQRVPAPTRKGRFVISRPPWAVKQAPDHRLQNCHPTSARSSLAPGRNHQRNRHPIWVLTSGPARGCLHPRRRLRQDPALDWPELVVCLVIG